MRSDTMSKTDCIWCPVPPRIGEPQPLRCDHCPYKDFVHIVEELAGGGRMHRFGVPGETEQICCDPAC